jgi:hypothetical protein
MNVVGLAETVVALLREAGVTLIDGGKNDTRIYALGTFFVEKIDNFLRKSII